MKKYPKGWWNKKTGKLRNFVTSLAIATTLLTGVASCNDGNTYKVKPGETIWALYQKTDKSMTWDEFKIAFISANEWHIWIEDGIIRTGEEYIIPTKTGAIILEPENDSISYENTNKDTTIINKDTIINENSLPEVDDVANGTLDSLMQWETPIATYLKLHKAYENIDMENKPSFLAIIAHIEQETWMYGQWADSEFKGKKADYFKHNNPFNITYKDTSDNIDGWDFYKKKDNIYKDGKRQKIMVKFNDYSSMEEWLEDYIENVTGRQYLLDSLWLGSIAVNNPLVYLYKLESTGYMQWILWAGDVDVYLSRQLNRPNDEKNPVFLVTRTDSTNEINYEVNKISRLMEKESELKKWRNNFVFWETKWVEWIFMTPIFFKEWWNRNLGENRFGDNAVNENRIEANKRIDEIEEIKTRRKK